MERIKLISMNVLGLNDKSKRTIARYITTLHIDIIGMQETHLLQRNVGYFNKIFKDNIYTASANTKQKVVMIGISPHVQWELKKEMRDKEGRYIILQGIMEGDDI